MGGLATHSDFLCYILNIGGLVGSGQWLKMNSADRGIHVSIFWALNISFYYSFLQKNRRTDLLLAICPETTSSCMNRSLFYVSELLRSVCLYQFQALSKHSCASQDNLPEVRVNESVQTMLARR